ncbi:MAG: B12-binding domain-containing radical SAM protein, partial [Magnetospirillum sp.]
MTPALKLGLMRILLINPLSGHFKFDAMSMPPLGILVVAAKLREEGHDVVFLDRNAILYGSLKCVGEPTPLLLSQVDRHVRQAMRQHQPQIVGITMMTCQMRDVRRISVLIRKMAGADTRIVLGGYHPTCEPSTVFRDIPEVDVIIRGQGEWAMAELAAGKPLLQIAGVSFRQRVAQPRIARLGDWVTGRIRPFDPSEIRHNLDSFWSKDRNLTVMPARDLIATDYYQREGDAIINYYYFHRPASIVTAQGCPKRCSFCASKLMESKLFFSPAQQMIEEVSHLVYDGGVTGLFFYDINFPVHRKRTEAFTTAMVEMGLADKVKWLACASADNLPYDLLPQMRRAGCVGLLFGFESASQRILDILNKDIDVNLHQKAVDACKANDIRPQSAFIVGVPGETEC